MQIGALVVILLLLSSTSAYGPFYGNRDLLCNRGTRFACYCSTVTWRRFNRTDAPLCSQIFPGFEAAILELATCDVRLENNPLSGITNTQDDSYDNAAITFERYLKRILATLIRRECLQQPRDPRCSKVPGDLDEEHIVFTSYQCSKDLKSSRLWMVVLGLPDSMANKQETVPQLESHFVDGSSIARVLTSGTVLPQLNSHLAAKNSHIINVDHLRLEDTYKRTTAPKVNAPARDSDSGSHQKAVQDVDTIPDLETEEKKAAVPNVDNADSTNDLATGATAHATDEGKVSDGGSNDGDRYKFSWVAAFVGSLFLLYFIVVWVLAFIFCIRKRREIEAKNRRLRGETTASDHGEVRDGKEKRRVDFKTDAPTTKKLMSRDEDSDYDNNYQ